MAFPTRLPMGLSDTLPMGLSDTLPDSFTGPHGRVGRRFGKNQSHPLRYSGLVV